jgi:hypothetical protein
MLLGLFPMLVYQHRLLAATLEVGDRGAGHGHDREQYGDHCRAAEISSDMATRARAKAPTMRVTLHTVFGLPAQSEPNGA